MTNKKKGKKTMTRDDIKAEILKTLNGKKNVASRIMKKIDEYVESCVIEARLEVMKNFKAI